MSYRAPIHPALLIVCLFAAASGVQAHDAYEISAQRVRQLVAEADTWRAQTNGQRRSNREPRLIAQATPRAKAAAPAVSKAPAVAVPFQAFAPAVTTRWDEQFLYIESNGLPAHGMMVGITAWQQQVPLPQPYTGSNAWRIPLHPVVSKNPVSIKGRFLRGAVALAVNGIPIFNPQNNRGAVSQEIGELDQWGGHCGRADDYHYHATPFHLQAIVGKGKPIAYALDGYPIYGLTEPDGSTPRDLDSFNGHELPGAGTGAAMGYHYHGSNKYPYVNGGFHGEAVEAEGQVDPQPRAEPRRPAGEPLRGARITAFTSRDDKLYSLKYELSGRTNTINYALNTDGSVNFDFVDAAGKTTSETYTSRRRGPAPDRGPEGPATQRAAKPVADTMILRSPAVADGAALPVEFTGDGEGVSPPLEWSGAPAGTKAFAILMHHIPGPGDVKWYWTVYNIPADAHGLPKAAKNIGITGNNHINPRTEYAPPHSKGPGLKEYTITLYALSEPLKIDLPPAKVSRDVVLEAMKGRILASSELHVTYTKPGSAADDDRPAPPGKKGPGGKDGKKGPDGKKSPGGGGGGGQGGLIKPAMSDTVHVNVYADNWFIMYINGKLVAVDPIDFIPHNVVSFDILPEYPMTIAVMAKDNADPKTGMEYGDHIGDAGLVIKFSDGTVTNAQWKAKSYFRGPLNHDTKNPRVEHTPIPPDWFAVKFDDSAWMPAAVFTEERVNPKQPYHDADFQGASFIWSDDLDLDNTVIFRIVIDKPGFKPRWNTKPDLDVTKAPLE